MKEILIGLCTVGLLAACAPAQEASPEGNPLPGKSYLLDRISVGDKSTPAIGSPKIIFTPETISVESPCNGMGGDAIYSADTFTIPQLAQTLKGCPEPLAGQDQAISEILMNNPKWNLTDETLTITSNNNTITATLIKNSAFPPPDSDQDWPPADLETPAEILDLCDMGVLGLSEEEATQKAEAAGATVRVSSRDGEGYPLTMDYGSGRVNFTIRDGIVTNCTIG